METKKVMVEISGSSVKECGLIFESAAGPVPWGGFVKLKGNNWFPLKGGVVVCDSAELAPVEVRIAVAAELESLDFEDLNKLA
jgi:hypothetical protein